MQISPIAPAPAGKVSRASALNPPTETVAAFLARGGRIIKYEPGPSGEVLPLPGRALKPGYADIPKCMGAQIDGEGYFPDPPAVAMKTVSTKDGSIAGVVWRRTAIDWPDKQSSGIFRRFSNPAPIPDEEAYPERVRQADELLKAAPSQRGRTRDDKVVRTASGRKSRARCAVAANAEALSATRHQAPLLLDRLFHSGHLTQTQWSAGNGLLDDLIAAERHRLLLAKPPRSEFGATDMRTYISAGRMKRAKIDDPENGDDQPVAADDVPGSTGTALRERSTHPATRRLALAKEAVQGALHGAARGWAIVTEPAPPGPRWRILAGKNGERIARRLPHPAHVWPGSGRPMLPLPVVRRVIRRTHVPTEASCGAWRWLASVVDDQRDLRHVVRKCDVQWLRKWLDLISPIYTVTGSERVGTKFRTRGEGGGMLPQFFEPVCQSYLTHPCKRGTL